MELEVVNGEEIGFLGLEAGRLELEETKLVHVELFLPKLCMSST
jgi:hypothetical protein